MRWIVADIAAAAGGTLTRGDPTTPVERFTQDTRDIGTGPDAPPVLFVALVADRDGHEFIADSGAAAALSQRSHTDLGELPPELAVIEVHDTGAALSRLGSAARARFDGAADRAVDGEAHGRVTRRGGDLVVVGITGSVGKTTTKDLLAAVFAVDRPTHASTRSFNNEIGVPLTILNAPDSTEALVLEMGARGAGHIADLCAVGRPTIGIVTTVGTAHTSEFGSVAAVAAAKVELVEALPPEAEGGVAVLNAANPLVAAMADRTDARVVRFGEGGAVRAENVTLDDGLVPTFRLVSDWGAADVRLGARGLHLVDNALAAAAAALASGVGLESVVVGLASPTLSPMRMALSRTPAGMAILDDSYNANPMSTEAALRSLAALPARRRIAVLGVMAELGDVSAAEHARIGELAATLGIEVIAVNAPDYLGRLEPDEAPGALVGDVTEAAQLLLTPVVGVPVGPSDAVLVKGSRVAGLERLVALLST